MILLQKHCISRDYNTTAEVDVEGLVGGGWYGGPRCIASEGERERAVEWEATRAINYSKEILNSEYESNLRFHLI